MRGSISLFAHRTIPVPLADNSEGSRCGGIHQDGWIAADSRGAPATALSRVQLLVCRSVCAGRFVRDVWGPVTHSFESGGARGWGEEGRGERSEMYERVTHTWRTSLSPSLSRCFRPARVPHEFSRFLHVRGFLPSEPRAPPSPLSFSVSLRSSHERACFSSRTRQCACVCTWRPVCGGGGL